MKKKIYEIKYYTVNINDIEEIRRTIIYYNEIGIEISQISRIERGLIGTSVATFFDISKALNIPLKDFFNFNIDE